LSKGVESFPPVAFAFNELSELDSDILPRSRPSRESGVGRNPREQIDAHIPIQKHRKSYV
jgi:hypothetical protein